MRSFLPPGYMTTTLEIHPGRREILCHRAKAVDNVVIDRACRTKLAGEVVGDMEKLFTFWDQYGWHRVTFYGDLREPVQGTGRGAEIQLRRRSVTRRQGSAATRSFNPQAQACTGMVPSTQLPLIVLLFRDFLLFRAF